MDSTAKPGTRNPAEGASLLSVLFFWWTKNFFKIAYNKILTEEELYSTLPEDKSSVLGDRLQKQWNRQLNKRNGKPSLLKAILITFRWSLMYMFFLQIANSVLRLLLPFILDMMLQHISGGVMSSEVLKYAGILAASVGICAFSNQHNTYISAHIGMQIRVACCSLIYRKALNLSQGALQDVAGGKVVNLLSNDVSRFDRVLMNIHYLVMLPIGVIVVAAYVSISFGRAAAFGVAVIIVIIGLQAFTGKLFSSLRQKSAQKTDTRIKLMDEIISAVQVIKMYAWEKPFSNMVSKIRREEVNTLMKAQLINNVSAIVYALTARIGFLIALTCMVLFGDNLTSSKVFSMYAFITVLSFPFASYFLYGLMEAIDTLVSIKRLQEFFLSEEFKAITQDETTKKDIIETSHVTMKNVTANWHDSFTLRDVTSDTKEGQLVAIIGRVGSGKSSLLQVILGELPVLSGTCIVHGKVSYASQDPWIFGATVRQNIVFGSSFDRERYNNVVNVCALQQDFEQFPQGDLTLVGDRGITLSGGQKARINLARAVYNDADIYLLDDPLSAVDTHVGQHLYDECINSYLKHKTRILVTHQTQFLRNADHIIILNNGIIETQGTYDEVMSDKAAYTKLLGLENSSNGKEDKRKDSRSGKRISQHSMGGDYDVPLNREEEKLDPEKSTKMGSNFINYTRSGANLCLFILSISLFSLGAASLICGDYWLQMWVAEEQQMSAQLASDNFEFHNNRSTSNNTYYSYSTTPDFLRHLDTRTSLYIYIGLIVLLFIAYMAATVCLVEFCNQSSKLFHNSMFTSVIRTRMRFFTINPSGRILNRFSKDMGTTDDLVPRGIQYFIQMSMQQLGAMIVISALQYILLIPMVLLGALVFIISRIFIVVSSETKRMEGIAKSPVFTHVNATIQGLTTVRAYGAQRVLCQNFDKYQDVHSSAWFMFIAVQSTCGFYVDLLFFFYITMVVFFVPYAGQDSFGEKTGLAVSLCLTLSNLMQLWIRRVVDTTTDLIGVERILEYTRLEEEPLLESTPDHQTPADWPTAGRIDFDNVSLKYSETGPTVLRDLNITINAMEKVGVVGRTGAGKSSLISTLFRLAWVEGSVKIDGVDTKDIPLQDLRRKLSIIPQDPVLFCGTIRRNLDPFEEFSDDVLWRALEEVELKESINSLDENVTKGGTNFSVGQRQLVCLARAILRNNKILVLDEATANVDPHTDFLIQKKVRERFENCTVLTIAHRLNTIMDSSKVLVIDNGTVVEFGHPYVLLLNKGGHFWKMVEKTGSTTAKKLRSIAESNSDFSVSRL